MTDYTELSPEELVNIGLAQLGEAQDAHRAALFGHALRVADVTDSDDRPAVTTLAGDSADTHSRWLLESAHAHFRAAVALDVVNTSMIDYGDEDNEEVEDDGPSPD